MAAKLDKETTDQITQCLNLLKNILGKDLLGVYLFGSAVIGGLQKYSDIDLFVVSERTLTDTEKSKLATHLLKISGIYMQSSKRPIELTLVVKSEVNPWHYPPKFEFQYGDWLRKEFESGNIEPWSTKAMPDLALLITQVLLANKKLFGVNANLLLSNIPYKDFILATAQALDCLIEDIESDTRNVLLTLARIWCTVTTDQIRSKPDAASWAIHRLPKDYHPVMKRAKAICIGDENEYWSDVETLIRPCAQFLINQINEQISLLNFNADKVITY